MSTIEEKLDALAEYKDDLDAINGQYDTMRDATIPDEIKNALVTLEEDRTHATEELKNIIAALEGEIKSDVLKVGKTIKGSKLQAVWSKGRTTWDGKKLAGMEALIPGLAAAKTVGDPSVSIRVVK